MVLGAAGRLVGLDVARCLALLGMVTTHVLSTRDADGELALSHAVAAGRSAALFAVLAGVTLALTTGRRVPVRGRDRAARSLVIVVRALLISTLGFALGSLQSGLAIILVHYGLLFVLGLVFVGLTARPLAALAVVWLLGVPVFSHVVRPGLPARGYESPSPAQLADPGPLLSELFLTGYYPVLPWLAYLLAGMAIGRLDLGSRRIHGLLLGVGALVATGSVLLSGFLTGRPGVLATLGRSLFPPTTADGVRNRIAEGMFGTTPTDTPWEWLLVVAPHSATPFDLAHTIGTAVAVIGLALLLCGIVSPVAQRGVAVLFGAGTMTLSLYTLHVVMRTQGVPPRDTPDSLVVHVAVLLWVGAVVVALRRRGPLEWMVARASTAASGLLSTSDRNRSPGRDVRSP
ncbi:MAG: heparan-alpha-glucosaminide N-acetyltransferase domain-containing protein [Nocardioides sp.]